MALVKCPECEADVSSEAAACPKCGRPMKATPAGGINPRDPVHVLGIIIAVLVGLGIVVAFFMALAERQAPVP